MLTDLLMLRPGISAFIGSGGKTSLIARCARELARKRKKVIVCTTTHIYPFPDMPLCLTPPGEKAGQLLSQLEALEEGAVCIGTPSLGGKLTAPALPPEQLAALADFCLVEADGAARHPLKAHAEHEPVIPKDASDVICVFGLGGFGKPCSQAVHRSRLFLDRLARSGLCFDKADPAVTPAMAAAVFEAEKTGAGTIFLNQADLPGAAGAADIFIRSLKEGPYRIITGSAQEGTVLRQDLFPSRPPRS